MPHQRKTKLIDVKDMRVDYEEIPLPRPKPTAGVGEPAPKTDEELRRLFVKSCMHATLKL